MTAHLMEQTYLPEPDDELAELFDFLKASAQTPEKGRRRNDAESGFFLVGNDGRVELPEAFHRFCFKSSGR